MTTPHEPTTPGLPETAKRRRPRGFVLIVALLLAIATAAVAVGLIQSGGAANIGVSHSNAGEAARALAEAGLARAESYALTISRNRVDFDLVLDPLREADCSNLDQVTDSGAVDESTTTWLYLPQFTDTGASTVTFEGLRWRLVPYNGGAYLVRFSDNFDDGPSAPGPFPDAIDWASSTSNTRTGSPGNTTWCAEGPASTVAAQPGINGVNNPARDRDRTIVATVIGIYPGTAPASAKHRAMMSKVIMDGRVIGPAGMRIGGNMNIANGAEVELCSEVSGINTTGDINTGPPGSCACGTVQATDVDIDDGSCGACCGTNTYTAVSGASPPAPVIPVVRNREWYDYTSSCNFYMDAATMSFYFWDASGSRGGTACNTYNADLPNPDRTGTTFPNSCWVPIWFNTSATPTTSYSFSYPLGIESGGNDEITAGAGCAATGGATCTLDWQPRNVAVPNVNLGTGGSGYYTGAATLNVTKPNWETACPAPGSASDFRWSPPQVDTGAGEEVHCTSRANDCDGSRIVLTASEAGAAGEKWQAGANPEATPVGVYFLSGNYHVTADQTVPGAQMPLSANAWPMMTLVVEGNVTMQNAKEIVLGAGTRRRFFPSLVVSGNFDTSNGTQLALAGSLYVRGNLSFDHGNAGGTYLYGRVEVMGNLNQASGSRVDWNYDSDLFAAGLVRRAREPRLGLPLGF